MSKVVLTILITILLLTSCFNNRNAIVKPVIENGILSVTTNDFENGSIIHLDGDWEFYWKQLLLEDDFQDEEKPVMTFYTATPANWNGLIVNGEKLTGRGYATFRLTIIGDSAFDKVAFKINRMMTASKVYVNGELLSDVGIVSSNKDNHLPGYDNKIYEYSTDKSYLNIIVQVSNFEDRLGGAWGQILFGEESVIREQEQKQYNRDYFLIGAVMIIGIYHLGLFLIRMKEREALYFFFYCTAITIRILFTGNIYALNVFEDIPWKLIKSIEYLTFFSSIPLFCLFIYSLFPDNFLRIYNKYLIIISTIFTLITFFAPASISTWLIPPYQIITVVSGVYVISVLIRYSIKKSLSASIILFGFMIMFYTAINDILYAAGIIYSTLLINYGILVFIIFQSIVMTMRFSKSFKDVESQRKQLLQINKDYRHELEQRIQLEEDLHYSYQKNATIRAAIIMGLAKLAEFRDTDTGSHLERIQEYNSLLARNLMSHPKYEGYITEEYIEDLHMSSILHDIGKVGIPDSILQKPGKLTEEEFEKMKEHSKIGGESIQVVEQKTGVRSFLTLAKEIAFMHHEKWDGSGYPFGVAGEKIPLSARLTALADVYDALTSERCYKEAFTHEKAVSIIQESSGKHFDPDLVEIFLKIHNKFNEIRLSLQDDDMFTEI